MTFDSLHLKTLCRIARAAGHEIMCLYGDAGVVRQKDDVSPLTEADLRADAVIRQGLEMEFPGIFICSEESRSSGHAETDEFFLVDPLDGTKEFIKRNGEFTVNIALVQQGVPVMGVVYAPALDELFYAAAGLGAWVQKASAEPEMLRAKSWLPSEGLRVIGSRSHGSARLGDWLSTLDCPHSLIEVGSSLKFCRVAQGLADIYPRLGPTSQWDTAAAQCVLQAAGGAVLALTGESLAYGLQLPLLNSEFVALGDRSIFQFIKLI